MKESIEFTAAVDGVEQNIRCVYDTDSGIYEIGSDGSVFFSGEVFVLVGAIRRALEIWWPELSFSWNPIPAKRRKR